MSKVRTIVAAVVIMLVPSLGVRLSAGHVSFVPQSSSQCTPTCVIAQVEQATLKIESCGGSSITPGDNLTGELYAVFNIDHPDKDFSGYQKGSSSASPQKTAVLFQEALDSWNNQAARTGAKLPYTLVLDSSDVARRCNLTAEYFIKTNDIAHCPTNSAGLALNAYACTDVGVTKLGALYRKQALSGNAQNPQTQITIEDFVGTAAHEVGHDLGENGYGTCGPTGSIMTGSDQLGHRSVDVVSQDDIQAVLTAYTNLQTAKSDPSNPDYSSSRVTAAGGAIRVRPASPRPA